MNKSKALRIGGFTLAVGVTASLVGFAAHGTGAYFSAATDGHANVSTGDVKVTSSPAALDFTGLMSGVDKSAQVTYTANGTGPEDIYLAFDDPTGDAALNAPAAAGPTPLGRYGHLKVSGQAGSFESYNLARNSNGSWSDATCDTDPVTGLRGNGDEATAGSTYCPAPRYILLDKSLTSADPNRKATITFGITKLAGNNFQDSGLSQIPFRIVAEQAGVSPYDSNQSDGN